MRPAAKFMIDEMRLEDLDEIVEIERASFNTPWPRGVFEMEIKSNRSYKRVSRAGERVLGYIVAWKMRDEIHILNVAVHPEFRRMGVAQTLLRHCLASLAEKGAKQAILEVRPGNQAAINLYKKMGFEQVRIRRGYYRDTGEDAIVMGLDME